MSPIHSIPLFALRRDKHRRPVRVMPEDLTNVLHSNSQFPPNVLLAWRKACCVGGEYFVMTSGYQGTLSIAHGTSTLVLLLLLLLLASLYSLINLSIFLCGSHLLTANILGIHHTSANTRRIRLSFWQICHIQRCRKPSCYPGEILLFWSGQSIPGHSLARDRPSLGRAGSPDGRFPRRNKTRWVYAVPVQMYSTCDVVTQPRPASHRKFFQTMTFIPR